MIEKTQSFKTGDGQIFGTFEQAQLHELELLLAKADMDCTSHATLAAAMIEQMDHLVDILTMKPSSKAKARKINGDTKKRGAAIAVAKNSLEVA